MAPLLIASAVCQAADESERLEALRQQIEEQTSRLERLERSIAEQKRRLAELRESLLSARGRGPAPAQAGPSLAQAAQAAPVGQAPEKPARPPEVAPIFEQPGVLTPRGNFVFEPSLQYSYSSSSRIALAGFTVIPALLLGVVDVREVKRNSFTLGLTGRYGLSNRLEIEARVPYVYRSDSTLARPISSGSSEDFLFEASNSKLGDIELTARYQLNDGGADRPYYIGSLKFKTRTGLDPFETAKFAVPLSGGPVLDAELPTGSGFYSLQPGLTVLYPSDPAVLFGGISYAYNFKRSGVNTTTTVGTVEVGDVKAGDIWGFNFGMGLAINEKSSFSVGYDHSSIGKTRINNSSAPRSQRVQLGTLLLGYSYRLDPKKTLNLSVGVGTTRDAPDTQLSLRLPMSF
jgi:hypothetical protein